MVNKDLIIDVATLADWLREKRLPMLTLGEEEFIAYTRTRIPPAPPNYLTIAALNKQGSYEVYSLAELEAGANRCAIA